MTKFVKDIAENKEIIWEVGDIFISTYGDLRIIAGGMEKYFLVNLENGRVTTESYLSVPSLLSDCSGMFRNAKKVHTAVLQDEQSATPTEGGAILMPKIVNKVDQPKETEWAVGDIYISRNNTPVFIAHVENEYMLINLETGGRVSGKYVKFSELLDNCSVSMSEGKKVKKVILK